MRRNPDAYWGRVAAQAELRLGREQARWGSFIDAGKEVDLERAKAVDKRGRRVCTRCRRRRAASAFYRDGAAFTRRMGWCRTCLNSRRSR